MYRRTPSCFFIKSFFQGGNQNQNQNQQQSGSDGAPWYERPDPMQNTAGSWFEKQRANLRGGRNPMPEDVGTRTPSHPSEFASPFFSNPQARTFETNRRMKQEYDQKQQQQSSNNNNEGWSPWDNEQYAQQMRNQQMSDEQFNYNQQKYNDKNKKWGYDPSGSSNHDSHPHQQQPPPDMHNYNNHQHMHGQPHSPNHGGGIPFMNNMTTMSGNRWNMNQQNQGGGGGGGNPAEHMMNSLARFGQMVRSSQQQQQQGGGGGGGGQWNQQQGGGGGGFNNNNPFGGGGGGGGPGGGMFDKMLEWCSQSHAQDIARRMNINLHNIEFMTQADGSVRVQVDAPNATPQQIEQLGKAVQEECPIARYRKTSMGEGNKAAEMNWVKLPASSGGNQGWK